MSKEQKPAFRRAFKEFLQVTHGIELGKLNDVQRSRLMTEFFVESVLRKTTSGLLPDDDEALKAGYVDGAHDKGIDFLYVHNRRVVIVQAKYRSESGEKSREKYEDFDSFTNVLARLHSAEAPNWGKNRELTDRVLDIDFSRDTFDLYYISLGFGNDDIREREERGQAPIAGLPDIEQRVTYHFLDELGLNEEYRIALRAQDQVLENVDVILVSGADGNAWLRHENDAGNRCFIGIIQGNQIYELLKGRDPRVFALNIRNYVGSTSTNKAIVNTATEEAENFFFFNNGISAVATKVSESPKSRTLHCERFSIINGAQTAKSIKRALGIDKAKRRPANASVLIRITEVSYGRDADNQRFFDNITRYNNTQNEVKIPDFRSNDLVQIELAKRFSKLSLKGKPYCYLNKRSESPKSSYPIKMEEFCNSIHSFFFGPADCFGGTQYLFNLTEGSGYTKIFGDGKSVFDELGQDEFEKLAGTWFLCNVLKEQLKEEREILLENEPKQIERKLYNEPVVKDALERRWLLFYFVGQMLLEKCDADTITRDKVLRKLSRPDWQDDSKKVEIVRKYCKFACARLIKCYAAARANSDFRHRNWFRKETTLDTLRKELAWGASELDQLELPAKVG